MNWQDYIVWAIGVIVLVIIIRKVARLFSKEHKPGCSCCSGNCCCSKEHKTSRKE